MRKDLVRLALESLALLLVVGSCAPVAGVPAVVGTVAVSPTATSTAVVETPSPAPAPPATPPAQAAASPAPAVVPAATPDQPEGSVQSTGQAADLAAAVQKSLPDGAFDGVRAISLTVPAGNRPLWAAFSEGRRNFEQTPLPSHFVAIYTRIDARWHQLARLALDSQDGPAPDYIAPQDVRQVQIAPSLIWLEVPGTAGAHGGTYQLLSFDGATLRLRAEVSAVAASPGFGRLQDLNGDRRPEAVLDVSDAYVFCYACGVRHVRYQVYRWDAAAARMREVTLAAVSGRRVSGSTLTRANRAVDLAQAGLWRDALDEIAAVPDLAATLKDDADSTLAWDYELIKLTAEGARQQVTEGAYPLLANVFYGDYAAAVDLMRPYTPTLLFSTQSPLIAGTPAESMLPSLTQAVTESTGLALAARPDLAGAYFLRGWAAYVGDPKSPAARTDVARAATLAPNDRFFSQAAAYLSRIAIEDHRQATLKMLQGEQIHQNKSVSSNVINSG